MNGALLQDISSIFHLPLLAATVIGFSETHRTPAHYLFHLLASGEVVHIHPREKKRVINMINMDFIGILKAVILPKCCHR